MTFAEVHAEVRRIVGGDAYLHLAYEIIESRGELTINWRVIVGGDAEYKQHASVHTSPDSLLGALALARGGPGLAKRVFNESINSVGVMPESDEQ